MAYIPDAYGNNVWVPDDQIPNNTYQGDASGATQYYIGTGTPGGANVAPAGPPAPSQGNFQTYFDPGASASQFGFSNYDPINDIAYDAQGNPVRDDGSDPSLKARLQAVRDATSARRLEFGTRNQAVQSLAELQGQKNNVFNSAYGPNLPGMQAWTNERISNAADAANHLGEPIGNAADLSAALKTQTGAAAAINGADAANVGRQNTQFDEYGNDLGQFRNDIGIIRNSAQGRGPSAAEFLARQQIGDAQRAMAATAATARGGNIAGGIRAATRAGTDLALRSTNQIGALRAQEQLQAMGLLGNANSQLAGAQGQRAGAINAARGVDVTRATNAAAAADAASGRQLGMGELETNRQTGRMQGLNQAASTQNQATNTAAEIARNEEDMRQSRARMAMDAYNTLTGQGMAPSLMREQNAQQVKLAKMGQEITGKDIVGGLFNLGGAALGAAGSIFGGK